MQAFFKKRCIFKKISPLPLGSRDFDIWNLFDGQFYGHLRTDTDAELLAEQLILRIPVD